jgi:hypothetical protein
MNAFNYMATALMIAGTITAQAQPLPDLSQSLPPDQAALVNYELNYDIAYKEVVTNSVNDIKRAEAEKRWDKIYCGGIERIKKFDNWIGRVHDLKENGYISVEFSKYNEMVDITIEPGTRMYKVISELREGQPVKISGYVEHEQISCQGVFDRDSISVRFTNISPF